MRSFNVGTYRVKMEKIYNADFEQRVEFGFSPAISFNPHRSVLSKQECSLGDLSVNADRSYFINCSLKRHFEIRFAPVIIILATICDIVLDAGTLLSDNLL